jgi:hypothetical protein
MEAIRSSETSVFTRPTRRHIPQEFFIVTAVITSILHVQFCHTKTSFYPWFSLWKTRGGGSPCISVYMVLNSYKHYINIIHKYLNAMGSLNSTARKRVFGLLLGRDGASNTSTASPSSKKVHQMKIYMTGTWLRKLGWGKIYSYPCA